ncbi:GerAB/ArcD/ProY family transporter [Alkalihalobacterium chitinilyticum]|uniref:Spore germination protein n=1 Tax=Alkalihalobacterium chitinilyticum TaxID=2980103 RepID=A0ABT5V957_9BACI|nr:GerAB/ArcD/ProY family transporter [Alkalihalobacterium chitinilyticum]MDE5411985.1 spore germination protein [Alkalihalobacterium chitinilyticum]
MNPTKVRENVQVSSYLVFFIIHAMQVGVGILGYQRIVVKTAGFDGWIAVIIAGIIVHLLIWMIYKILNNSGGDIVYVHQQLFGKWFGGLLSFLLISYFFGLALVVLRTFIEVVQVWMFAEIPTWFFSTIAVLLLWYLISGGFRAVIGMAVISVFIPIPLFLLLILPLEFANIINLLPIWRHSVGEMLMGAKDTTLSFLGFELLLMYYPFLKHSKDSQRWAQLGALYTTFIYTILMVISLVFYSEEQLNRTIWATLTLYKIVELPFIERFEYISISLWMIIVAPNIALAVWAATRGCKRLFNIQHKKLLLPVLLLLVVMTALVEGRESVNMLNEYFSLIGFGVVFFYIPILFIIQQLVMKVRKGQNESM